MQRLIIIRGHSGSGKSTFAKQKIAEFKQQYPDAKIFHVENDQFLMRNGEYCWTKKAFCQAKMKAYHYLQYAFRVCRREPTQAILIVVSNVGVNVREIHRTLAKAQHLGLQTAIYRMMNFYQNQHGVAENVVESMFESLNSNPIENEIFVKNEPQF
ncbi:hypothetical protein A4G18_00930 [Pasteurellaceae bacterium Pebbles2]|nr:hypothetical protein [Pasteurellaceae bacterium Pebbles2]